MHRLFLAVSVSLLLVLGACGGDDDDGTPPAATETDAETTADSGADSTGATPPAPEPPVGEPEPDTDLGNDGAGVETGELTRGEYEDAVLDCVFGENEAASCELLEEAGFGADGNYGLGNGFSQAPADFMRVDCLDGVVFACAELNARVASIELGESTDDQTLALLCTFHGAVREGAGAPELDFFQMARILGPDAPVGVSAGLETLETDPTNADALESVRGYVDPICADRLD